MQAAAVRRSTTVSSDAGGPLLHLDSAAVVSGKLYTAHSNYDESPMASSVEVFDARTLRHVATHSFGIERGSLTWLDRHDGAWWAGFANYDVVPDDRAEPYGGTDNTQVVKLDDRFRVLRVYAGGTRRMTAQALPVVANSETLTSCHP